MLLEGAGIDSSSGNASPDHALAGLAAKGQWHLPVSV